MSKELPYSLWIEVEEWTPGSWHPADANTDVIVMHADGTRWEATFFTYKNILSLTSKYKQTGECLSGRYFWASDMILVEEITRPLIESVISELIQLGDFESVFVRLPDTDTLPRRLPL